MQNKKSKSTKKTYEVALEATTMYGNITVRANSENEARKIALEKAQNMGADFDWHGGEIIISVSGVELSQ